MYPYGDNFDTEQRRSTVKAQEQKSIGVFDSGIGGLTVVKQLMKGLPNENISYFGDTARVPYGNKSDEVITQYAIEDANFLCGLGIKLMIVACNTASSVAMDVLRQRLSIPVLGVIEPGVDRALTVSRTKRIGIIGTRATIHSGAYETALKRKHPEVQAWSQPCPLFVPLAEEGWGSHRAARLIAEEYLSDLRRKNIDTLILGCTHYPILRDVIQEAVGSAVTLVDSGEAAAEQARHLLDTMHLRNTSPDTPFYDIYVSDVPQQFKELGEIFLGRTLNRVTKVSVS